MQKKEKNNEAIATPKVPGLILLSRNDVSKALNVSIMTIKRWQYSGLLPPIFLSSRLVRYKQEDVVNLIKNRAS